MTKVASKALVIRCVLLLSAASAHGCIVPSGVDQTLADSINSSITPSSPWLWLPIAPSVIAPLASLDSSIGCRAGKVFAVDNYNTVAMYHPTALDIWGRGDNRMCSAAAAGISDSIRDAHEQIASTFAFAYSAVSLFPELESEIRTKMQDLGLDYDRLFDPSASSGDPWALAKTLVDDMVDFRQSDGWNEDGSLSNGIPFSDFFFTDSEGDAYTPYRPTRNPKARKICKRDLDWFWEPLEKPRKHVTPFIGFTGRLYGLSESQFQSFSTPPPDLDWCDAEADFAIEQTRDLATSDLEKMQAEYFNSKYTSLLPLQIQFSLTNGHSLFEFWSLNMALFVAWYDATLLAWRDKILYNLVRPTTVVQEVKKKQKITTYGGPGQGVQTIRGKDWEPYLPPTSTAEYPSATSCLCTVFRFVFQIWTRSDIIDIPLQVEFPMGTSTQEPGMTPAEDLTVTFNRFSDVEAACGASRTNAGLHFSQAVPAGQELCTFLPEAIVEKVVYLRDGDPEGAMVDFNDRSINVKNP